MYIVAKIHNNSLGLVFSVDSQEKGIADIISLAQEQFERDLTEDEVEELNNNLELINDEDSDNVYCWSLGIVEDR